MAPDIFLALVADVHQSSVLGVNLSNRVISGHPAMLAMSRDDFILEDRFSVHIDHPLKRNGNQVALI
jgi:hypothetical protein